MSKILHQETYKDYDIKIEGKYVEDYRENPQLVHKHAVKLFGHAFYDFSDSFSDQSLVTPFGLKTIREMLELEIQRCLDNLKSKIDKKERLKNINDGLPDSLDNLK